MSNRFTLAITVHPGSSRREIIKKGKEYHLYTTKKPIDGEANRDAIALIAKEFNVSKGSVRLTKGEKSKKKIFTIEGYPILKKQLHNSEKGK